MRMSRLIVLLLPLVFGSACFPTRYISGNSWRYLTYEQSHFTSAQAPDELALRVIELLTRRGFPLVNRRETAPGKLVYQFKGFRETVAQLSTSSKRNSSEVDSTSIGSVFYAEIEPLGTGSSLVLSGWSSRDGLETCTKADPTPLGCDFALGVAWADSRPLNGREEAELIRGMLIELGMTEKSSMAAR
ncbi:hypothetical protein JRI60_41950 [Archangium violaceum]|uniref:hypothetical protein n=1 Tax=Archangium violaceum TaxID=83451 RepID=UPI00194E463F|nr:hypothetical protein [Archangium violaceum]QRN95558.1 hypothetical protein JRI60_41950 [Archangium violaceum]